MNLLKGPVPDLSIPTISIFGYGCVTAAGQGSSALFDALKAGRDCSWMPDTSNWPIPPTQPPRVCTIDDELMRSVRHSSGTTRPEKTVAHRLAALLSTAWHEAQSMSGFAPDSSTKLGLIFASTKGCSEDYLWQANTPTATALNADPYTPVVERFLALTHLRPLRCLTISNACSSAHVALELAGVWLAAGVVDHVIVLSADLVGPFIVNGFASLKSLAQTRVTPFGKGRQGIQLGDAAAVIVVGRNDNKTKASAVISAIDTRAEGYALTRSNETGATLEKSCRATLGAQAPDAIFAHATGTPANDAMEDQVYSRLLSDPLWTSANTAITATKWCIGHTLGASGMIDIIAAIECLKRREIFAIANTSTIDKSFATPRQHFLTNGDGGPRADLNRILVASAGFGGMHGTAVIERP